MSSVQQIATLTSRFMKPLAIFFLFFYFFLRFMLIPVHNNDFWLHLAIGKYIVENQSLLEDDPYSFTTQNAPRARQDRVHKGDWLSKLILYKVYSIWDFKGIIMLRSLLLVLFLLTIFATSIRQNVSYIFALLVVTCVFFIIINQEFAGERPQLFTFLIFAVTCSLLDTFLQTRSKTIFLVPLFVMALSNMHAGYIICIFIITIYIIGEIIVSIINKDYKNRTLTTLLIVLVVTVITSTFNPTGPLMLFRAFSIHGEFTLGILEWKSPLYLYAEKISPVHISYVLFLVLSLFSVRYRKTLGTTHMLLLVLFSMLSFISFRYMIFYMCVAAPILGRMLFHVSEEKILRNIFNRLQGFSFVPHIATFCIGVYLVFHTIPSFAHYRYAEETTYSVPKDAANFLWNIDIQGNMLNMYGFGGYFMWSLYPEKKVFIDGRGLDAHVLSEYIAVMNASEKPPLSSEEIIKKYNISYIVTSPLQPSGEIFPLVEKLFDSREWALIYRDHLTLIFLKNDSRNSPLVRRYAMNKTRGLKTVIFQASSLASHNRVNPFYPLSLGKVFFKMGNMKDAEKAFRMAYERDPENTELMVWMEKLEKLKRSSEGKVQ